MERAVRRQIYFRDGEVCLRRSIIHRGVVILNALGDRRPQLLPVLRVAIRWPSAGSLMKAALEQDRRNLDVPQDMKAGMAHAAIEGRDAGQNRGMDGSGQRDVLGVLRIAGVPCHVGRRNVVFARTHSKARLPARARNFPRRRRPPTN